MSLCMHCGTAGCMFCRREAADVVPGSNPWAMDPFNPPTLTPKQVEQGGPSVPSAPKAPKPIPEIDRLIAVQNDALKALHSLRVLQDEHKQIRKDSMQLERHLENTYKVINRYLRDYSGGGGQALP